MALSGEKDSHHSVLADSEGPRATTTVEQIAEKVAQPIEGHVPQSEEEALHLPKVVTRTRNDAQRQSKEQLQQQLRPQTLLESPSWSRSTALPYRKGTKAMCLDCRISV